MRQRELVTRQMMRGLHQGIHDTEEPCTAPCCRRAIPELEDYLMCEFCGAIDAAGRFETTSDGKIRCHPAFICNPQPLKP